MGITPLNVSTFVGYQNGRSEFILGCAALGLNTDAKPIQPQQYVIADALNASDKRGTPAHTVTAICVPRRASKTTSVFAVALGRMMLRDDFQVGVTAQTGVKARARFLADVAKPLERLNPNPKTSPWYINRSMGAPFVEYKPTGARMSILPPTDDSFRGEGFDLILVDEAQEVDAGEESAALLGGMMPTMDTKPQAQLVLLGTAGEHRGGLFWDQLELGRAGDIGIIEYAADPDTLDADEGEPIDGTTSDPRIWKSSHPGIGNLTPLVAIERNFTSLTLAAFKREYLGIWPIAYGKSFINLDKWNACRLPNELPDMPDRFAIAVSVHPGQSSASIVAAWRDDDARANIMLLDHRDGTRWLAHAALALARKYKKPIIYDNGSGVTQVEVEQLHQATPRPKLDPQSWPNVSTAAALIVKEITTGNLRHYTQPAMDDAVRLATKRGTQNSTRWALGRQSPEDDITPLEAASLALRALDGTPIRRRMEIVTG